jgi:hypothetical protein
MRAHIVILGTVHELTGAQGLARSIDDPTYRQIVQSLFRNDPGDGPIDFVFEEIAGKGPTFASVCTAAIVGPNRYLDVDPPAQLREVHGIPRECARSIVWDPMSAAEVPDDIWELNVAGQRKREEHWLKQIQAVQFKRALLICGSAHMLSMAFKLEANGFWVETKWYEPFHRLCRRKHVQPLP